MLHYGSISSKTCKLTTFEEQVVIDITKLNGEKMKIILRAILFTAFASTIFKGGSAFAELRCSDLYGTVTPTGACRITEADYLDYEWTNKANSVVPGLIKDADDLIGDVGGASGPDGSIYPYLRHDDYVEAFRKYFVKVEDTFGWTSEYEVATPELLNKFGSEVKKRIYTLEQLYPTEVHTCLNTFPGLFPGSDTPAKVVEIGANLHHVPPPMIDGTPNIRRSTPSCVLGDRYANPTIYPLIRACINQFGWLQQAGAQAPIIPLKQIGNFVSCINNF